MRWLFAFILGICWLILSLITDSDTNMIIANIWMAASSILASK
nr:MAG TPA: hypothetical protein [Caudoviricetes sp.]